MEKVTSTYTENSLTFTTGHFSQYVVLEADSSGDPIGSSAEPHSVSPIVICLLIAVVVAAGAVTAVIVLKKKKK